MNSFTIENTQWLMRSDETSHSQVWSEKWNALYDTSYSSRSITPICANHEGAALPLSLRCTRSFHMLTSHPICLCVSVCPCVCVYARYFKFFYSVEHSWWSSSSLFSFVGSFVRSFFRSFVIYGRLFLKWRSSIGARCDGGSSSVTVRVTALKITFSSFYFSSFWMKCNWRQNKARLAIQRLENCHSIKTPKVGGWLRQKRKKKASRFSFWI